MPLLETASDTFDDNIINTSLWPNNFGVVSETGGRARVTCDTGFAAYSSAKIYTLQNSYAFVRVFPPADGGAITDAYAQVIIRTTTDGTDVMAEVDMAPATPTLTMANRVGFVDAGATVITYDSTNHRFIRIRETGGNTLWDTSPDRVVWTNRKTVASPTWVPDVNLEFQLLSHRSEGTVDFAEFDDFNIFAATAGTRSRTRARVAALYPYRW